MYLRQSGCSWARITTDDANVEQSGNDVFLELPDGGEGRARLTLLMMFLNWKSGRICTLLFEAGMRVCRNAAMRQTSVWDLLCFLNLDAGPCK